MAMPTNGTSGLTFSVSSATAFLQSSLESRLRQRMDVNGSLEYALTWKDWDMESGPPICALRARARRISGSGFGGWPSPRESDSDKSVRSDQGALKELERKGGPQDLDCAAHLAGWPTPDANAMNDGESLESWKARATKLKEKTWLKADGTTRYGNGNGAGMPLQIAAQLAGWPKASARDWKNGQSNQHGKNARPLNEVEMLAGWATPNTPSGGRTENRRRPTREEWIWKDKQLWRYGAAHARTNGAVQTAMGTL